LIKLVGCPRESITKSLWDAVEPYIEKATDRSGGRYRVQDIRQAVLAAKKQLWIIVNGSDAVMAAVVTEIRDYPTGVKACNVVLCAGEDHRLWVHHIDGLKDWAKERGCSIMEVMGRDGWTPALREMGYRRSQAVFEMEIC